VIGSGLGGLSCAAAFARQGYRPLVLEKHVKPGGYATTFVRPGGFTFEVSLHSTAVGERNNIRNLIAGFPEMTEVEFVPLPYLYRAIFPDYDFRVAQNNLPAYLAMLHRYFPQEKAGIDNLFGDMGMLRDEVQQLAGASGQNQSATFAEHYPNIAKCANQTWGDMMNARLHDPKLKSIVSAMSSYFGLPPSRLASFYYAVPAIGYLEMGGCYPKVRSQDISNAFVHAIEKRGGKVMLNTRVERILTKDGAATGVRCAGGEEFHARAVVSNANAWSTFQDLVDDHALAAYRERLSRYSASLSAFHVFLGLKEDLVGRLGIKDAEVFVNGYDGEAGYQSAVKADVEHCDYGLMLYDNVLPGYSPKGKNTLNLLALQGFGPWERFEKDYREGRKTAYKMEKERLAEVLIARAERLLPGLSKAIEVREIGTPLTHWRYTGNYKGAIYGWDQTLDNSNDRRLGHATPVKGLYLAGAWTRPGGGYGGVIRSGLECYGEIAQAWA
jgi:all-trans-retinol 13,14-reductase